MDATKQTYALLKPIKTGRMELKHRVVLAPMTRVRGYASHVPGPQQASYYSQRGSVPGTLLITEATVISYNAGGAFDVPGIYTDAQIEGWKNVTNAVHAKGSYIFLQLWALGRVADIDFLEKRDPPSPYVSASSVTLTGRPKPPRPLTKAEIKDYIAAYANAASNAIRLAGFDGVEIHSAYGHLLDQFLQSVSNKRTDMWGGDEEGRTRFAREVVDAVVNAVGEDRVGIRISPWSTTHDMKMLDPRPTFAYLATALRDKHPRMAYLHVVEPPVRRDANKVTPSAKENSTFLREIWNGGEGGSERSFISTGGYTRETALRTAEEKGGLIAFARLYMSNESAPYACGSQQSGNLTPLGYTDWPFADDFQNINGTEHTVHSRLSGADVDWYWKDGGLSCPSDLTYWVIGKSNATERTEAGTGISSVDSNGESSRGQYFSGDVGEPDKGFAVGEPRGIGLNAGARSKSRLEFKMRSRSTGLLRISEPV